MASLKLRLAVIGGLALPLCAVAASASAGTGCNGYVNQAVWGCAPWDNNNGPQYPHYKGAATKASPTPAYVAPSALAGRSSPLISSNGNGIVASGGGNLGAGIVASGGGNGPASGIVASGGGNIRH